MESWIMDARYAARRLVRRPLYALLSVLTLALGIGGTAAVYGIARPILLEPLPYTAEEQLVTFWNPFDWNEQEFLYLRDGRFPGFATVAAYMQSDVTLSRGDSPAQLLPGISASSELFTVLGARPALGRAFQAGDDVLGAEPVAVISYGVWQDLGGDPSIIGTQVRLDGTPRTIVGVMPRGFWFPDPSVRVWLAKRLNPENRSGNYALVGRVAPGQQASAMAGPLAQFVRILDERFDYPPQWDKTKSPVLTPLRTWLVGSLTPALIATLTALQTANTAYDLRQVLAVDVPLPVSTGVAADTKRGRRPSFDGAAAPEAGQVLFDQLIESLRATGVPVATGEFGGDMRVSLVNDGPATFIVDSRGD